MSTVTSFDRPTCREISKAAVAALQAVAKQHGLAVNSKGGSFSGSNFTMRLEWATKGKNGTVNNREAEDFKRYAESEGVPVSALGQQVTLRGREYTIIGFSAKSPKYPFLLKTERGAVYKFRGEEVAAALKPSKKGTTQPFAAGMKPGAKCWAVWSDGKMYKGTYLSSPASGGHKVKFDDGVTYLTYKLSPR